MKPSDFIRHPYDSVLQKTESEIVARNIMVILKRNGNEWRELTWTEYSGERQKDGEYAGTESGHFKKVLPYCVSAEQAMKFSPTWRE